jgi:hypothetical protein
MQQLATGLTPALETIFDKFLDENPQPYFSFRTLDANKATMPVVGPEGNVTSLPVNAARILPGRTKIRTAGGKQVWLLYSVEEQTVEHQGVTSVVGKPEPIAFEPKDYCILAVRRDDREKLVRLLFSDECRNSLNPDKRRPDQGEVYELIEPAKTAEQLVVSKEKVLDAQIAVRQAADSELKLACERLSLAVTDDRNLNAASLYDAASADPAAVLRVLSDEWDKTTALVRDLTTSCVIEFDAAERKYLTTLDRKAILNVPTGNFEQALIKHLSDTQGQNLKRTLGRLLEEANKKKGKK